MTDSPYGSPAEQTPADPEPKKPTASERMKERWEFAKAEGRTLGGAGKKKAPEKSPGIPTSGEKRPAAKKVPAKRENTSELWGEIWESAAQYAVEPVAPYAARAMSMQVDVVGMILDEETAGTFIDRMAMQPIARRKGAIDAIRACAELPIRCEFFARAHAAQDIAAVERMRPGLVRATKRWLIAMAPRLAKMKAEEEKARKTLAELEPELAGGAQSLDQLVDSMLETIFAGPPPQPQPASQESAGAPA